MIYNIHQLIKTMRILLPLFLFSTTLLCGQTVEMRQDVTDADEGLDSDDFVTQMEKDGFTWYLDVNSEVWANTSEGFKNGALGLLQLQFGFEVDF